MNKKVIRSKYCILGFGYASLIAYHKLLKKNDHEDILILQSKKANPIFTLEHNEHHFSPLPIFPVAESELYNSDLFNDIPEQKPITVRFSELKNFDHTTFETKNGSLADYMMKTQSIDKNLCLGAKQWGEEMFSTPFSQVQSKIKRHYVAPKGNTRIGYLNGQSLFKYAVNKLNPNIFKYNTIKKIEVEKKEIHLEDHVIRYNNLISTIPIHYLFQLCDLKFNHNTSHAGCQFHFFTYDSGFEENQMIYDCDYQSDIIRVFSIQDNLLMVQFNSTMHKIINLTQIKNRLEQLAPSIINLSHVRELYVPMCYPLEVISDRSTLESIAQLKNNAVVPFGRFGKWEYSDLHELDWTSLTEQK